jgi:hypothetical protein
MFGTNWSDPQTLWLNITNLALGLVTLLAVLVLAAGVAWELVERRRRAREVAGLDREMVALVGSPHVLSVPGLGLTMADGGEPIEPPKDKKREERS